MVKTVGVFCAASVTLDAAYYELAEQFGEWLGRHGMTMVYGGANSGLMESAALGVRRGGGKAVGVVPRILESRRRVSTLVDEVIRCEDLTDRKAIMVERSDVLVALPGGIGTLDEVFTVMASHSIGYHSKRVVLFDTAGFWDGLLAMLRDMDAKGFVNVPLDRCLTVARSWDELENALLAAQ